MITEEFLEALEKRAREDCIPSNSWEGYLIFLRFLSEALGRVPTVDQLETCDIDQIFGNELERLAQMVAKLFKREPFEELSTFLRVPPQEDEKGT